MDISMFLLMFLSDGQRPSRRCSMSKRKFLTWREVSHMMQAVSGGQTGARDCCLILLAFRHGLRISELLGLRFRDLDLQEVALS
jgi:integrase